MGEERLPWQATSAATPYRSIASLPVSLLLEDVRSAYNVGSVFRTADATGLQELLLCGYTARPPHKEISKTALGAEDTVRWRAFQDSLPAARALREDGRELVAIETSLHAVDLFDWVPRFPLCLVFGNEVTGVRPELGAFCDTHVRIPMLGHKHSLNIATAVGVVLYELLRKYRRMLEETQRCP